MFKFNNAKIVSPSVLDQGEFTTEDGKSIKYSRYITTLISDSNIITLHSNLPLSDINQTFVISNVKTLSKNNYLYKVIILENNKQITNNEKYKD